MYDDSALLGVFRIAIYSDELDEPIVAPCDRFLRVGDDGRPSWDHLCEVAGTIMDVYDSDLEEIERCQVTIGTVYVPLKFRNAVGGLCSVRIWRGGPDSAPTPAIRLDAPSLKGAPR